MAVPHRISHGSESINEKADYLNMKLQQICENDKQVCFVDANPALTSTNYPFDGLHFSHSGCQYFGKFLSTYISHSENFHLQRLTDKS